MPVTTWREGERGYFAVRKEEDRVMVYQWSREEPWGYGALYSPKGEVLEEREFASLEEAMADPVFGELAEEGFLRFEALPSVERMLEEMARETLRELEALKAQEREFPALEK